MAFADVRKIPETAFAAAEEFTRVNDKSTRMAISWSVVLFSVESPPREGGLRPHAHVGG